MDSQKATVINRCVLAAWFLCVSLPAPAKILGTTRAIDVGTAVYLIAMTEYTENRDWLYNDAIGVRNRALFPWGIGTSYWFEDLVDKETTGFISANWISGRTTGTYCVTGNHKKRFTYTSPWEHLLDTPRKCIHVNSGDALP